MWERGQAGQSSLILVAFYMVLFIKSLDEFLGAHSVLSVLALFRLGISLY